MKIRATDIADPAGVRDYLGLSVYDAPTVRAVINAVPTPYDGTGRSFTVADVGAYIRTSSTVLVTLTIPSNDTAAIPIGATFVVEQGNVGIVTVTASGGVTLNSRAGLFNTAGQFAVIQIKKVDTNVWTLIGDVGE